MSVPNIDSKDLELIAHLGETSATNPRLEKLANAVAINALNEFATKQLDASKIEADFYDKFRTGLETWKSQVDEVAITLFQHKKILEQLWSRRMSVALWPGCTYFTKIPFHGNIEKFRKCAEEGRFEFCKCMAQAHGREVAEMIEQFWLFHESDRAEIAKICAQADGEVVAKLLPNFDIKDPGQLFLILLTCLQHDETGTLGYIKNFRHADREGLFALVKEFAKKDVAKAVLCIDELGIDDEAQLIEILKICAHTNAANTAHILPRMPIGENEKLKLYLSFIKNNPMAFVAFPQKDTLLNLTPFQKFKSPSPADTLENLPEQLKAIHQFFIAHHINCSKSLLATLVLPSQAPGEDDPLFQIRQLEQLNHAMMTASMLILMEKKLTAAEMQKVLQTDLIPSIADFPHSNLKWRMIVQAIETAKNDPASFQLEQKPHWRLILSMLVQKSCSPEVGDLILKASNNKFFKDGKNQKSLLEALLLLSENDQIDKASKNRLLQKLVSPLKGPLAGAEAITAFGEHSQHLLALLTIGTNSFCTAHDNRTLFELMQAAFLDFFPLEIPQNFQTDYAKTFGSARSPVAFIIYAAKLKTLNNPRLLQDFARYVNGVFRRDFIAQRHSLADNPHLEFIAKSHPAVVEKWFEEIPSIILKDPQLVAIDSENPIDLLFAGSEVVGSCQAIDGDPEINQGLLGYLLDGKIRMITLKTKKGDKEKIIGRALLKLLWDGEKPVLFLERLYVNRHDPIYKNTIVEMAERKAKSLGVDLVITGAPHPPLYSLGGPAAFEYSDAAGGLCPQGIYTF
jgi:hypothetical protein